MTSKSRICEICGVRERYRPGFFANFPIDEQRCRSWVQIVGKEDLLYVPIEKLNTIRFICEDHFSPRDFNKKGNRLKKRAYPKLNLSAPPLTDHQLKNFPLRVASQPGNINAQITDERLHTGEPHIDHTYVVPPKLISEPFEVPGETHKPGVTDGVLAGEVIAEYVLANDVLVEDFTADDLPDRDPSPVPEVEAPAEESLFSWQKADLIEADDPDDPPVRAPPPPTDPTLALTCDPDPGAATQDQAVPTLPALAEKDVENRCKDCEEINEGFRFWCVECSRGALCGACAGRPPHRRHHVLRAPARADTTQTRAVLMVIRQQLQNENLLSPHETCDDGLKVEVKEEPPEPPPEPEPEPPAEPDPLACEPHENECIAEQIVDHPQPLKLPQLAEAHARKQNTTLETQLAKVSTAPVKRKFLFHLEKLVTTPQQVKRLKPTFPACKENLLTLPSKVREYQGLKIISQTTGDLGTTRQNQASTQAHIERIVTTQQQVKRPQTTSQACKEILVTLPSKVREYQGPKSLLETLTASPSQTAGNFTDITRPNQASTQAPTCTKVTSEPQPAETVIIDLDGDETVEYLEEGLDSDIETVEEVVLDDNETNEDDNLVTNEDDNLVTNEDDALDHRETNEDDALDDEDDALDDREINEDDALDDRVTNEDDALDDRETNEVDSLDDRETNEVDSLDDRETNEDDALDDRVTNEDDDGLDDRDDDVLDEDYLVDDDDLSEDDESDDGTIVNFARKGVKRKIDAKQTLSMRGPAKSIIREDNLIEDDLSDEDPIVDIAGRGVKRKGNAEEPSPARGPCGSMARALPSKAVVQVRPLSSLEIRNWTADRKRHRKY